MFQGYQSRISEIRKALRQSVQQKSIYDNCFAALKRERSLFRKAETKLKKYNFGRGFGENASLYELFKVILESKSVRNENKRRDLLYTKLNQLAGGRVIAYLESRIDKNASVNVDRSLIKTENRLKQELEKAFSPVSEFSQAANLIPFSFKIEDLKVDEEETSSAIQLGEGARKELLELSKVLKCITEWGNKPTGNEGELSRETDISGLVFDYAVNSYMMLCAFKNELSDFFQGRDLVLHLQAISDFKLLFFNNLIVDWVEEGKIKLSALYVRKTINSLEALLQGLNARKIKIESELSITIQERDSIIMRLQKEGYKIS